MFSNPTQTNSALITINLHCTELKITKGAQRVKTRGTDLQPVDVVFTVDQQQLRHTENQ